MTEQKEKFTHRVGRFFKEIRMEMDRRCRTWSTLHCCFWTVRRKYKGGLESLTPLDKV